MLNRMHFVLTKDMVYIDCLIIIMITKLVVLRLDSINTWPVQAHSSGTQGNVHFSMSWIICNRLNFLLDNSIQERPENEKTDNPQTENKMSAPQGVAKPCCSILPQKSKWPNLFRPSNMCALDSVVCKTPIGCRNCLIMILTHARRFHKKSWWCLHVRFV